VASILDMKTVLIGYVLSSAICLAAMAPVWAANRKRAPAIDYWLADYVLQFVALSLITLRGVVPDFVSMVIANTLVVGGTVLLLFGLQRYLDREGARVHNYAMLVAFVLVQTYFALVDPSLAARNLNISAGLLFVCAQIAWLMLRQVAPEKRDATRGVGLVMVAYSALSVVRMFVDLTSRGPNDLFSSGTFDTAVVLSYGMLFIALTFGMLLMVNRRLVSALESDIVVREVVEARLRDLSHRDSLTGLLNSRAFHATSAEKLARTGRSHASLIYLDLDLLKETNDTYGHHAGDAALVALAGALRNAFRESDVIGRLGGDEFAVLAISREAATTEALVARFATEMAAVNNSGSLPFKVSASLGIASWDPEAGAPDLETLIRIADARMYDVKREKQGPES
jgi:diguanylate cyclase (GGDEF)-like protein